MYVCMYVSYGIADQTVLHTTQRYVARGNILKDRRSFDYSYRAAAIEGRSNFENF